MLRKLFIGLSCLFMLGCKGSYQTDEPGALVSKPTLISGKVFYKERKMLPPGALLTVTLEDVSKMDVASTVVASVDKVIDGAPPYAFSLAYPADQVQASRRYSLRAKITLADKLLMTSTLALNPFVDSASDIQIILSSVGASIAKPEHAKTNTEPAVVSVNPLASLTNTYWKLLAIDGQSIAMDMKQSREAFIQLNDLEQRIKGFAGCNQLMGGFTQKGNDLRFSAVATTRKACLAGMDTEQRFVEVIEKTAHFSIHEEELILFDANKKPLAQFQAQYFN
ncbi:MAG: META domain-containing protein [Gammaproteobacteria bacterium]|nr:META domain-containing protein [Gammaproteobacteria bacterium]